MENDGSPVPKTSQESVLSSRASCSETSSNHPRNRSYLPKVSTEHLDACHPLPCMTGVTWTATPMNVTAARSLALPWDGQDPVPHTLQEKRNCMPEMQFPTFVGNAFPTNTT